MIQLVTIFTAEKEKEKRMVREISYKGHKVIQTGIEGLPPYELYAYKDGKLVSRTMTKDFLSEDEMQSWIDALITIHKED